METNEIVKRIYYAVKLQLVSPLCVSSGEEINTDSDVMRNWDGECFIPGTSTAGALRSYLGLKKEKDGILGYSQGQNGRMSSLFLSDMYFEGEVRTAERDGIRLKEDRTVEEKKKFQWEIIDPGAETTLYLEYIERKEDKVSEPEKTIEGMILAIHLGKIRFGSKKTSGFGRMKVKALYKKCFRAEDWEEWLKFMKHPRQFSPQDSWNWNISDDFLRQWEKDKKICEIVVPLRLTGGISIRRYSTKYGDADYEHLSSAGNPVVPGSSLRGVFRADARRILRELKCEKVEENLEYWFGSIEEKRKVRSKITIEEGILRAEDKYPMSDLKITRNKISRFENVTVDTALYTERAHFGGRMDLVVHLCDREVKGKTERDGTILTPEAMAGLLLLVIQDMEMGYLPVGGEVAIGRGIFEKADVEDQPKEWNQWEKAFYHWVKDHSRSV